MKILIIFSLLVWAECHAGVARTPGICSTDDIEFRCTFVNGGNAYSGLIGVEICLEGDSLCKHFINHTRFDKDEENEISKENVKIIWGKPKMDYPRAFKIQEMFFEFRPAKKGEWESKDEQPLTLRKYLPIEGL